MPLLRTHSKMLAVCAMVHCTSIQEVPAVNHVPDLRKLIREHNGWNHSGKNETAVSIYSIIYQYYFFTPNTLIESVLISEEEVMT